MEFAREQPVAINCPIDGMNNLLIFLPTFLAAQQPGAQRPAGRACAGQYTIRRRGRQTRYPLAGGQARYSALLGG